MMHGLLHIMQEKFEINRTLKAVRKIRDMYIEKMQIPETQDRNSRNAVQFVESLKQPDGEMVRNFENLVFQEFAKSISQDVEILSSANSFNGVSRAMKKALNEDDAAHETIKTAADEVGKRMLAEFEKRFKK